MGMPAYRAALEAVAGLPVRVLMTIGRETDPDSLGAPPANVHVEPWVPQADVLGRAAAVIGHGGSGTTLGSLAAGVPQVVVPLFADQPQNATRVAAVGAGLAAQAEPDSIRDALQRILDDDSYRGAAAGIAAEMRALPPVDDALAAL
jgi:MGT family glycosyltransferase